MSITEAQYRNRLGRFILVSNLVFGCLLIFFYLIRGFDTEEFTDLIKVIIPIKSAYLTALIRYVVANRNVIDKKDQPTIKVNQLFVSTSFIMIIVHIVSLITATSLYALFNLMDFGALMNIILGLETFFGVYVGVIIASMFKVEDEKEGK